MADMHAASQMIHADISYKMSGMPLNRFQLINVAYLVAIRCPNCCSILHSIGLTYSYVTYITIAS